MIDLHTEFSKMTPTKGNHTQLSAATIRDYVRAINHIYKLVKGTPFDGDLSVLENYTNVIAIINKLNVKHKAHFYGPIIRLLKHIDPLKYTHIADSFYYPEFITHLHNARHAVGQHVQQHQDAHRYITLNEVLRRFNAYTFIDDAGTILLKPLFHKTIAAFYLLNPAWIPRNDLHTLIITSKNSDKNNTDNYIVLNNRHRPDHIILNSYKTSHSYGKQIIKISTPLKNILVHYLQAYPRNYADLLFHTADNKQFADSTFSTTVATAFLNVLQSPLNIDIVRQIHITAFNAAIPNDTHRKIFAKSLLQSSDASRQYPKLNLQIK